MLTIADTCIYNRVWDPKLPARLARQVPRQCNMLRAKSILTLSTPSTFQVPQLWHRKLKHWNVPLAKSHRGHRRALCAEGGRHHLGGLLYLLTIGHQGLCMACHLDDHLAGQPLDHLSDQQAGWPFKKRKVQNLGFRCWKLIQQLVTSQENIFSAVASHSLLDFCMKVTTSEVNVLEKRMDTTTR